MVSSVTPKKLFIIGKLGINRSVAKNVDDIATIKMLIVIVFVFIDISPIALRKKDYGFVWPELRIVNDNVAIIKAHVTIKTPKGTRVPL